MPAELKTYPHPDGRFSVCATFDHVMSESQCMRDALIQEIVRLVAERYVQENYQELVANLDQKAIANLAVADAGKKIAEEIRQRPVVYREKGDTHNKFSLF